MRPTRLPSSRSSWSSRRTSTPSSTVGPSGTSAPGSPGPRCAPVMLPTPSVSAPDRATARATPAREGFRTVMTFSPSLDGGRDGGGQPREGGRRVAGWTSGAGPADGELRAPLGDGAVGDLVPRPGHGADRDVTDAPVGARSDDVTRDDVVDARRRGDRVRVLAAAGAVGERRRLGGHRVVQSVTERVERPLARAVRDLHGQPAARVDRTREDARR